MIRRDFIRLVSAAAGATTLGAAAVVDGRRTSMVRWRITGFTCVTCATGLEVMLERMRGVVRAAASYPEGRVTIQFRPHVVDEATLRAFLQQTGFTVGDDNGLATEQNWNMTEKN